jgi:putative ABC transport system permease protein
MIILFLLKENSFDRYHENSNSIYKLIDVQNNSSAIDYRVVKNIVDNFPEVQNACFAQILQVQVGTTYNENGVYIDNIMSVNNSFFKIFTIPFVSGNASLPFTDINSVVITQSTAKTLFNSVNPIGKEIVVWHHYRLTVTAVIKDFPDNSSINANVIVNAENQKFKFSFSCGDYKDVSSHRYPFGIYLQLKENTNAVQLKNNLNLHSGLLNPYVKKVDLIPLKKIYLYDNTIGSDTIKGNPDLLTIMAIIAVIILALSIINYVNLSIARQNKRNKETGIRKTIGAGRKDMILFFLTESISVTFASIILCFIIIEISLPAFNKLIGANLSINPLFQFPVNVILFLSMIIIGLIAGIGPALLLSSYNPVKIFRGELLQIRKKSFFRNALTVFQFAVSIGLIFCVIIIQKQMGLIKNKNLGFDKEQLLYLDFPISGASDTLKVSLLKNKFKECSGIISVSGTQGIPGQINNFMGSQIPGKDKMIACILADSNFLKTFNIQIIKGRKILPGDMGTACMLNESAYKYFEWGDLKNKRYNNGREGGFEVIGIVKDFNFASLHQPIEPLCIMFANYLPSRFNIRIAKENGRQTMEYIQKVWKEIIPDYPIKYRFYDEWFDSMYKNEEKFSGTINLFAFLAIIISSLGILGLAAFSAESRTKELGIRKVHGATLNELMFILNKDIIKLVFVASFIALPVARYAMKNWLKDFAYRTEINWWVFILAGLAALFIAIITISWHTWRAVNKNPVEVLRYE